MFVLICLTNYIRPWEAGGRARHWDGRLAEREDLPGQRVDLTVLPCVPLSGRPASGWARCCMPPCRASSTRKRAWGPRDRKSDSWADSRIDPHRWSAVPTFLCEPKCVYIFLNDYEFKAVFVRVKLNSVFWSGLEWLGFFRCKP